VFNALEISKGINTTDWNINDIWKRLYQCITRANTALQSLDQMDEKTYPLKNQRIAEMRFLRGHAHFMLKQLFKKIVIVNDENMEPDAYMNCRIPLIPMTSNGKDSRRLPVCLRQPAGSTNRKAPAQAAAASLPARLTCITLTAGRSDNRPLRNTTKKT